MAFGIDTLFLDYLGCVPRGSKKRLLFLRDRDLELLQTIAIGLSGAGVTYRLR